jgi:protein phosphatase 1 regulatory subunit 3A/B/C/D/E
MVRFADSIGRELAQVQYIQSPTDDDDLKDFSLGKNGLYLPKTSLTEHKPWSFDVASPSKQISDKPISRRFFCLYRQPNSEHPDIYLHEIWKSQIKLEHADVRLKSPLTGEQYLHGTLWVTNASYWKNVTVKYSFNRWVNTYEYEAQYRFHSNDFRNIDQFEFNIDIPQDVDRIDFVLRYHVNGQEHWDNNGGKNYTIETDSASTPQTIISLPHDCDFNEMRFY